jgi:putative transcriptional regulator
VNNELFSQLMESIEEGGAILRGEAEPSRTFEYPDVDVKELRERYKLSQDKFASLLGISPGTLRGWEQGRRRPDGAARVLLRVAEKHPRAVLDTVRGDARLAAKGVSPQKKKEAKAEARA